MTRVEKLLSISSEPVSRTPPVNPALLKNYPLGSELLGMLEHKNGFYAFESALHVFPLTSEPVNGVSLAEWNSDSLWRNDYGDLTSGLLFFAEDIMQDQFCLSTSGVLRFSAETGGTKPMADSLENWADIILRDFDRETGWTFANKWQAENGPLPPGKRLMPKSPFFLGGAYSLENLWAGDAVEGMRFKADLAIQTKNLPDGSQVRIIIGERPPN
ncbi:MAG: hypothetical protein ABR920_11210 [Terriglobales bacterium]